MHAGDLRPVCSRDRSGGLAAGVEVPLAEVYLEFYAPNDRFAAALDELRSREFSDEELLDGAEQLGLGAYVARRIS